MEERIVRKQKDENKKKKPSMLFYIYTIVTLLAIISAMTAATYAWFTGSQTVDTNRVTAETSGDKDVKLLVSTDGSFKDGSNSTTDGNNGGLSDGDTPDKTNGSTCSIKQVNKADAEYLLPVSTSNLKTFLYNDHTVADMAKDFTQLKNEEHIYHGRFYIKAETGSSKPMKIYLSESKGTGGKMIVSSDPKVDKAARLGIVFNGDYSNPIILKLSENDGKKSDQIYNTVVDGKVLDGTKVLAMDGNKVSAVNDPSRMISDYVIDMTSGSVSIPEKPIYTLTPSKAVPVDVFFYLEGCDPDTSDKVKLDTTKMHLGFYGIIAD